jgi:hypothetical protein
MPMDWLNMLESISIITVSVTAIFGINSWRKEERWKKKYGLAEDVLSLFYESEQVIRIIRSPVGYSGEGKTRTKSAFETQEESAIYDKAHVVFERFERNKEVIDKLQTLKFRFIAVFEKEHGKLFDELTEIINDVFFASREIAGIRMGEYGEMELSEKGRKLRELQRTIYWSTKLEDDPIEQKVRNLIREVEKICKMIIGEK